jgi:5-methylcytosine-specific restriction protein B
MNPNESVRNAGIALESALQDMIARFEKSHNDRFKAVKVKEWFDKYLRDAGSASVVTEEKQIGNRVIEQSRHRLSHAIYVVFDPTLKDKLSEVICRRAYPEMKAVWIVHYDEAAAAFSGILAIVDERCPAVSLMEAIYPGMPQIPVETKTPTEKERYVLSTPSPTRQNLPLQLLVHGCPGSGKSYFLSELAGSDCKVIRVVFHPETTYGDFVGVYRPTPLFSMEEQVFVTEGGEERKHGEPYVTYDFVPGPLVEAFCYAQANAGHPVVLVIEELSRANAAMVFGDMQQLLDRADEDDGECLKGESLYAICPRPDLRNYLLRYRIPGASEGTMRFPSNLHIWATMNRSDQNARQLDVAFLRRWDKKHMSHTTPCCYGAVTLDTPFGKITWDALRNEINSALAGLVPEDKFVGPYFLRKSRLADRDAVAEDLLGYLWNDVLKNRASELFTLGSYVEVAQAWRTGVNPFRSLTLSAAPP